MSTHGYSKERRSCFGLVWHWLRVFLHTAGMARVVWQYISGTHGVLTGYSRGMYWGSRISRSWVRVLTWAVGLRFRVQTETLTLNRELLGARRQRVARSCAPHGSAVVGNRSCHAALGSASRHGVRLLVWDRYLTDGYCAVLTGYSHAPSAPE